jgi:hypothetical protein
VAERLELGDEPLGLLPGVLPGGDVVLAQFVIGLAARTCQTMTIRAWVTVTIALWATWLR